jgi:hypothetical protein
LRLSSRASAAGNGRCCRLTGSTSWPQRRHAHHPHERCGQRAAQRLANHTGGAWEQGSPGHQKGKVEWGCRIVGASLLRKPLTSENTLTRSRSCDQRAGCRCSTQPTPGALRPVRGDVPAIGPGGAGWSSPASQGQVGRRCARVPAAATGTGPIETETEKRRMTSAHRLLPSQLLEVRHAMSSSPGVAAGRREVRRRCQRRPGRGGRTRGEPKSSRWLTGSVSGLMMHDDVGGST